MTTTKSCFNAISIIMLRQKFLLHIKVGFMKQKFLSQTGSLFLKFILSYAHFLFRHSDNDDDRGLCGGKNEILFRSYFFGSFEKYAVCLSRWVGGAFVLCAVQKVGYILQNNCFFIRSNYSYHGSFVFLTRFWFFSSDLVAAMSGVSHWLHWCYNRIIWDFCRHAIFHYFLDLKSSVWIFYY